MLFTTKFFRRAFSNIPMFASTMINLSMQIYGYGVLTQLLSLSIAKPDRMTVFSKSASFQHYTHLRGIGGPFDQRNRMLHFKTGFPYWSVQAAHDRFDH